MMMLVLVGCSVKPTTNNPVITDPPTNNEEEKETELIASAGFYTSKDEVALYIYVYHRLPGNYRRKGQIEGHISKYWTPENLLSIGGDVFYNREMLLPIKSDRTYYEADIDYRGESNRNSKRIVYSSDGLIFYTADHYDSFVEYDIEVLTWKS